MRVPLSWLRDYVDIDLAPEQLAERLTVLGMEVKGIERWGAEWRNVVVGELLTVQRHPRADRLSLTTVNIGSGEPLEIVCGATNIAAGQRVPVALPGAVLPGGRQIERAEKMGVVSNGMLCSGDELKLTSDADGILILPADTPLGADLADLYGDVVLDVDVKPNRGDALSLVGLAREVAAATGTTIRFPSVGIVESGPPIATRLSVDVAEPDLCSRFVARLISGVTVGPSPDRVQMRLRAAGMRPVSNVVDATNYVMLELGKPTHAFDAAAIHGQKILVRRAKAGEPLETLDHVQRTLDPETLVIADPEGAVGIAGVMGGATSEVTDATRDVIVESAIFDPVTIRRTGQRYALRSEASLRFEKGQEVRLARIGADRVAQLIAEWAGGTIAAGRIDTAPTEPEPSRVAFRPARVGRLLADSIDPNEQRALLARVDIDTERAPAGTPIVVAAPPAPTVAPPADEVVLWAIVPTWRRDLAIEADLTEEVARIRGYETTPGTLTHTPMPAWRPSPLQVRDRVRHLLVGAGLFEVVTHALVAPERDERLGWPREAESGAAGETDAAGSTIRIRNPLSSQHSVLRRDLVGSLLDVVATNLRQGREDVAIFEVGKGYGLVDGAPREWWRLGIALTGAAEPRAWNRPLRLVDLDDLKGLVQLIAGELGGAAPVLAPMTNGRPLHPGRAATVTADRMADGRTAGNGHSPANGRRILAGTIGELHLDVLAEWEIRAERVLVAELSIAGLTAGQLPVARVAAIDRFPAVERDLAVVVAAHLPAAMVEARIRTDGGGLLRDVRLFDVYPMPGDDRSLAYRLTFQAADRTLTESEIEAATQSIVHGLSVIGGRIRG